MRPDRAAGPPRGGRVLALALCLTLWLASAAMAQPPLPREIVLGVPTSLGSLEGRESLMAVRLAVEEINAAGGVRLGGRSLPLKVAAADLKDHLPGVSVPQALGRLERFLDRERPQAVVVGPFRSEVLLAAMDILARRELPTLGAIAMSPVLQAKVLKNPAYRFVFRVGLDARYLADYLIGSLQSLEKRLGPARVLILNQDVAWARSTASLMVRLYFERAGWQVLGQENLPGDQEDFRASLGRARAGGAQVILAIFDSAQSARLVEQWHAMGQPAVLCGFISPAVGPGAWRQLQGAVAGLLNMVFELGNLPSARYGPSQDFHQAFQRRYGAQIEAGHGPAPSYEAVHILKEALERAGSLNPEMVATALEHTDRQGVMGRVRFHRGHQVVYGLDPSEAALACVVQWGADGRRRIVYPPAVAEGEMVLPAPRR